jgi:hypothetical protein
MTQPPEFVYAPAHPVRGDGEAKIEFEVRAMADGTRVLPVFSSVDALVEALGPMQPWALLPMRAARAVMGVAGVPEVVLDPPVAPDAWRWSEQDLADYAEMI